MSYTIDDARTYIAKVRWHYAATMPRWPHEYTVLTWRPELEAEFFELVTMIRSEGVVKPWPKDSPVPRYHHHYLEVDGWQYWTMDDVIADTQLINRARIDEPTSA